MALLSIQDLSLGYDQQIIIRDLNFTVNKGDYLCIVGENGSGKTTLMKTLVHLMEPLAGRIIYGEGLKDNETGYLPQQTLIQRDFPASVREIVLSGCLAGSRYRPFYNRAEKQLAAENMDRMGISDLAGRCYRELSGGQQQRVLLARALCTAGRLLLLDEPVSGLDPKAASDMYEVIKRLNGEGITIIMVSHDIMAAVRYASHILHIGEEVFFGSREDYIESGMGRVFMLKQRKTGTDREGETGIGGEVK